MVLILALYFIRLGGIYEQSVTFCKFVDLYFHSCAKFWVDMGLQNLWITVKILKV